MMPFIVKLMYTPKAKTTRTLSRSGGVLCSMSVLNKRTRHAHTWSAFLIEKICCYFSFSSMFVKMFGNFSNKLWTFGSGCLIEINDSSLRNTPTEFSFTWRQVQSHKGRTWWHDSKNSVVFKSFWANKSNVCMESKVSKLRSFSWNS